VHEWGNKAAEQYERQRMPYKVQNHKAVARAAYIANEFHDAVIRQVVDHAYRQGYVASRQRIAHSVCLNDPNV